MNRESNSLGRHGRLHADADNCAARHIAPWALTYLRFALVALALGVGTISCAVNPATGERHLNLIGESREIAMGQQADSQVVASIGLYPNDALQRYVQELGARLASTSERPDLPWTFE